MAHPFLIKEIALQAGLSEATVDRVLNNRSGVRKHTAQRVKQAIRELDGQSEQAGLTGRKLLRMPGRATHKINVIVMPLSGLSAGGNRAPARQSGRRRVSPSGQAYAG